MPSSGRAAIAGQLAAVHIIVDDRPGRVEVRTEYDNDRSCRYRNIDVSVDYTVLVPAGATVDVKSISGNVTVTGVQGAVHAETVSGTITTIIDAEADGQNGLRRRRARQRAGRRRSDARPPSAATSARRVSKSGRSTSAASAAMSRSPTSRAIVLE